MKLYGSDASPFVRRIRWELKDRPYEFVKINMFDESDRLKIKPKTPLMRIPFLEVEDKIVWDSLVITEYLHNKTISVDEKLNLILINEMTDSALILFQLKSLKVDSQNDTVFSKMHLSRIRKCIKALEENLHHLSEREKTWLYISLDWFDYREILNWKEISPIVSQFFDSFTKDQWIQKSDPRS